MIKNFLITMILSFCFIGQVNSESNSSQNSKKSSKQKKHLTLLEAAKKGKLSDLKALLKDKNIDINKEDKRTGATPLVTALSWEHPEVALELIKKGADIAKADEEGSTPLFVASSNGYLEVVKELIKKGADVNLVNRIGTTPLIAASQLGHLKVVEVLVDNDANVNKPNDQNGMTPLIVSSMQGHIGIVGVLLANGADIDVKTKSGSTAHDLAKDFGYKNVVKLLNLVKKSKSKK